MNAQRSSRLQRLALSTQNARGWRSHIALLPAAFAEYKRDYAQYFAGAMVYYALLSLVPLMLLVLAGLGLFLRLSDTAAAAEQQMLYAVEARFGAPLRVTIEDVLQRLEQGSVTATLVSLTGLLLAASVLFLHLRMTFRAIWKVAPPIVSGSVRSAIHQTLLERGIAFALVLGGGLLLLSMFVVIAAFNFLIRRFNDSPLLSQTVSWLLAASPLLLAPLTFALLFKFLPPVRIRWREVWLAAVLCGVAWLISTELLALYLAGFGYRFGAYGALGGVLILMLWMYIVSKALFFGAELCKVAASAPR
jgi:membrane protein